MDPAIEPDTAATTTTIRVADAHNPLDTRTGEANEQLSGERRAMGRRHGPRRAVLLVAAALVLAATVGVAFAVGASLRDRVVQEIRPSVAPVTSLAPSGPGPSVATAPSTSPRPSASLAPLQVSRATSFPAGAGSARMAPGPDGGVWVLADHESDLDPQRVSTTVIGLIDRDGTPRSGWPIAIVGWRCDADSPPHTLAVASDGSIRLVCRVDTETEGPRRHVALAFDTTGGMLPGWPVELPSAAIDWVWPVVVGDELRILASEVGSTEGSTSQVQPAAWWLLGVAANGELRVGARYEDADAMGSFDARIAADGVAYRVASIGGLDTPQTAITAFDFDGVRPGWPVIVDGTASPPAVAPDGRLLITRRIGQGTDARAQTMRIDPAGGAATATSDGLPIDPLDDRTGAGAQVLTPIVSADGAIFVVGSDASALRVFVVDPPATGHGIAPARLDMPLQPMGVCNGQDTGCGVWRVPPVVGPDGTLYVPESAVGEGGGLSSSSGGSLVAIAPDGSTPAGWPVFLLDSMAGYRSLLARTDGTIDALAVVTTDAGDEWTLVSLSASGKTLASTPIIRP